MVPIALVACVSISLGQTAQLPVLSPAKAVDIRVKSTDWHPNGQELIYTREEENGLGIGLYKLGDPQGKVVLHLAKDDRWSDEWFAGTDAALITVYRKEKGNKQGTIYLVDADKQTATVIFSRTVTAKQMLAIHSELSPSLTHAILDVTEDTKHYHVALTLNSKEAVAAPDIDEAIKEGYGGPAWSADGTAIYAKGLPNDNSMVFNLSNAVQNGDGASTLSGNGGSFTIQIAGAQGNQGTIDLSSLLSNEISLRFARAKAPAAGTPVMELMPSNATLRQIRSPGPWVEAAGQPSTVVTMDHTVTITFGAANGSANSVWLTPAPKDKNDRNRLDTEGGVLVAPRAESAEVGPNERAVAYIIDGALFVREIGRH